jgi:amino acid permease
MTSKKISMFATVNFIFIENHRKDALADKIKRRQNENSLMSNALSFMFPLICLISFCGAQITSFLYVGALCLHQNGHTNRIALSRLPQKSNNQNRF